MTTIFAFLNSPQDWLVVVLVGIVLFGIKRLPELGRSLGKGIIEFKKGMKGLEDDVDGGFTGNSPPPSPQSQPQYQEAPRPPQRITTSAPKFDDPANPSA